MPILFLLAVAAAATTPARDLPPMDYFCAAPVGHHSQVRIRRGGNSFRVRGLINPVQLEPVPDTSKPIEFSGNDVPYNYRGAEVEIIDDESGASVALRLVPRNRQASDGSIVSDISVQTWIDGDDRSYELTTQTHRDYRDAVPFEIVARGDRIRVQTGTKRLELNVPFGPKTRVELTCVGGRFDIEDIAINELSRGR